jgi:type II secretory pathway pseudopilin PulG
MLSRPRTTRSRRTETGFTVLEVIVSMILLGVVLSLIAPLAKRANEQRQRNEDRRAALFELSNVLEQQVAEPDRWPADAETQLAAVPAHLQGHFPQAEFTVSRQRVENPAGYRFDAAFTWMEPNGRRAAPLRLSAFAFPKAEGTP